MHYKGVFFLRKLKKYVNRRINYVLFILLLYFCTAFDMRNDNFQLSTVNCQFVTRAVLYDQLPRNPPGWEHSKGTWL